MKQMIDTSNWKEFKVGDIFTAVRGSSKTMREIEEGTVPIIAAARSNNGVAKYGNVVPEYENAITVSCNGAGCGSTFYQHGKFAISGDAMVLKPEKEISKEALLYIVSVLDKLLTSKYSYEDKISPEKIRNEVILLPPSDTHEPDWDYMENYMKSIENNVLARLTALETAKDTEKKKIDTSEWKEFKVGDLFTQERGKESAPNQNDDGLCPLIKETSINNGFDRNVIPTSIINGNCITVSVNYASTVFYQPASFCASVNILVLRNPNLSMYSGLFISSILSTLHAKYDYTYKISKDRLNEEMIKLPATPSGDPDWAYMENYMKGIENKVRYSADVLMR